MGEFRRGIERVKREYLKLNSWKKLKSKFYLKINKALEFFSFIWLTRYYIYNILRIRKVFVGDKYDN